MYEFQDYSLDILFCYDKVAAIINLSSESTFMHKPEGLLLTHVELKKLHDVFEPAASTHQDDVPFIRQKFRSIFISDAHIGRHDCKSHRLTMALDLSEVTETAWFVGDIFDYWLMRAWQPQHLGRIFRDETKFRTGIRLLQYGLHLAFRSLGWDVLKPKEAHILRWPQAHNDPIQKILRMVRKKMGILLGGNHDELLRGFTNNLHLMGKDAAQLLAGGKASDRLREAYAQRPALGNLELLDEAVYVGLHGDHFHVCHGDKFDPPYKRRGWPR